jgi:hypothetical protein
MATETKAAEPASATSTLLREITSAEWHKRDIDFSVVTQCLDEGADPHASVSDRKTHRNAWEYPGGGRGALWLVLANSWAGNGSFKTAQLLLSQGAKLDVQEGELLAQRWAMSRGALRDAWWKLAESLQYGSLGAEGWCTFALLEELRQARTFSRDVDANHVGRCLRAGADPEARLDPARDGREGSLLGEVMGAALAGPGAAKASEFLLDAGAQLSVDEAHYLMELWAKSKPHAVEAWTGAVMAGSTGQEDGGFPPWLTHALLCEALKAKTNAKPSDAAAVQRALHAGADPCVGLGPVGAHDLCKMAANDGDRSHKLLCRNGAEGREHPHGHESAIAS